MSKKKVLLLLGSIFGVLYVGFNILLLWITNSISSLYKDFFTISILSLSLLSSIYFFCLSVSKKVDLNKHKIPILLASIVLFINNVLSGIAGFVVFAKLNKKEMRELPTLEVIRGGKWYNYLIYIIDIAVSIYLIFFLPDNCKKWIMYSSYVVLMIINGLVFRKDLIRDFKFFIKYFREYSSLIFKTYIKAIIVLFIIAISIRLYTGIEYATNQESIMEGLKTHTIMMAFLAVLYAPFVEEILFRGILRKFINNKWFYIILSGLLFGVAHVIDDFQSIQELLYILVYSTLGCYLASVYYKTNNIFCNMFLHFIQNFISVVAILILLFIPGLS